MRGKKFGGLAVLAAAWAASPTAQARSQPYNDLNISTGPQTLLPQRDSERGIQIPGYFGGPAKMTTSAATSGVWYGAANLLNPQSAGTFVLYSGSWSESAKWSGAVVPDGGGTATLGEPLPPTSQERHDSVGIILNQNVALSQINMTNESGAEISNLDGVQNNVNTGKTITNTGTGLTINSNGFLRPFLGTTIWLEGNIIRPDIVGTGSVTVTGVAPLSLTGNNTFSGGLNIINGTI